MSGPADRPSGKRPGRPASTDTPTVFDALASPVRRAVLDALVERDGQTLFELTARLIDSGVTTGTRQAVTQHLAVLEQAGLVRSERLGRQRVHQVDLTGLQEICDRWRLHDARPRTP